MSLHIVSDSGWVALPRGRHYPRKSNVLETRLFYCDCSGCRTQANAGLRCSAGITGMDNRKDWIFRASYLASIEIAVVFTVVYFWHIALQR